MNLPDTDKPRAGILNPAAFAQVATPGYGNISTNALRGPASLHIDAQVARIFPIRERFMLHLHPEALNILNHPDFRGVDATRKRPRQRLQAGFLGRFGELVPGRRQGELPTGPALDYVHQQRRPGQGFTAPKRPETSDPF